MYKYLNKQIQRIVFPRPATTFDLAEGQGEGHSMVPNEDLVTTIMHAKYQCSIINTSEDKSQVKVFVTDRQTDGRAD